MKQYRDKEWLTKKYADEKLSTTQMGILCKVNKETIRRWIHKHKIPIRLNAKSLHFLKGNHCTLSQEAIEWINGELLGDGCIQRNSNYSGYFGYGSKYKEYIEYVRDTLKSFGIEQMGNIRTETKLGCFCYHYFSLYYSELLPIRKQWYPEGKKIVPKDIVLTPLTVRQWYIGDGSLGYERNGQAHIELYTMGFMISDVEWLIEQLNQLGFKVSRHPSINSIGISVHSTKDFLNYIGNCPVECYQYKWARKKKEMINHVTCTC